MIDPFSIFVDGAEHSRFGRDADNTKVIGGFTHDRITVSPLYLPFQYYPEFNTTLGIPVTSVSGTVKTSFQASDSFDRYASGDLSSGTNTLFEYTMQNTIRMVCFIGGGSCDATFRVYVNNNPKCFFRTSSAERNGQFRWSENGLLLNVGDVVKLSVSHQSAGLQSFEAYFHGVIIQ